MLHHIDCCCGAPDSDSAESAGSGSTETDLARRVFRPVGGRCGLSHGTWTYIIKVAIISNIFSVSLSQFEWHEYKSTRGVNRINTPVHKSGALIPAVTPHSR